MTPHAGVQEATPRRRRRPNYGSIFCRIIRSPLAQPPHTPRLEQLQKFNLSPETRKTLSFQSIWKWVIRSASNRTFNDQAAWKLYNMSVLEHRIVYEHLFPPNQKQTTTVLTNKQTTPRLNLILRFHREAWLWFHGFEGTNRPKPSASGGPNSKRQRGALEQLEVWASEWPMQDRVVDTIPFEKKDRPTKLHLALCRVQYLSLVHNI